MQEVEELFKKRRSREEFNHVAGKIYTHFKDDPICVSVLVDIQKRLPQLTAYMTEKHIPRTTNLIESYNSHLEGRLKTIKGFESFTHADRWLNGHFIKRRLQPFTSCTKQFRQLNGTCSIEHTMKNTAELPKLLRLIK